MLNAKVHRAIAGFLGFGLRTRLACWFRRLAETIFHDEEITDLIRVP
jgi:hypothetical protein